MRKFIDIINESPSNENAVLRLEIGALKRGAARKLLDRACAARSEITYVEEKEFLESKFTVRGPTNMLAVVRRHLADLIPVTESVEIDDEIDMPEDQENWDRQLKIEQAVKRFCEQEAKLSFGNRSYQINYDADENEISISPDDEEVTLEQLMKLRVMGEVMIACSGSYELNIKIKTPQGFNISGG